MKDEQNGGISVAQSKSYNSPTERKHYADCLGLFETFENALWKLYLRYYFDQLLNAVARNLLAKTYVCLRFLRIRIQNAPIDFFGLNFKTSHNFREKEATNSLRPKFKS